MKTSTNRYHRRTAPPTLPQLPQLAAPPRYRHKLLTITTIQVYDRPWCRKGTGTQWIVAEKPIRRVGENEVVCLTANLDRRTGIGRLSQVADIDKHWVTFRISGATPKSSLRVPIPWARLPSNVAAAHTRAYLALETIPPHPVFRTNPAYRNPHVNPYQTARSTTERMDADLTDECIRRTGGAHEDVEESAPRNQ